MIAANLPSVPVTRTVVPLFPGHAEASEATYRTLICADDTVGDLIGEDMTVHMMPASDVVEFARHPLGPAWLLAAVAQWHSGRLSSDICAASIPARSATRTAHLQQFR